MDNCRASEVREAHRSEPAAAPGPADGDGEGDARDDHGEDDVGDEDGRRLLDEVVHAYALNTPTTSKDAGSCRV